MATQQGEQIDLTQVSVEDQMNPETAPAESGGTSANQDGGAPAKDPQPEEFGLREVSKEDAPEEPGSSEEDESKEGGEGEPEKGVIDIVKETIGVDVEGEFPDTEQGIAQYTAQAARDMALRIYESQKNQDPLVSQVIDHANNGGDPRELLYKKYPAKDYRQIGFKEEDPEFHKEVLMDYFTERGFDKDEARGFVQDAESNSTLVEKARNAHRNLAKLQEDAEKNEVERQRQAKQQQQENIRKFWDSVKADIDKRQDVAGIPLAEGDKQSFFSYISDTADSTREMSQADLDRESRDYEESLKYDYIQFLEKHKGVDIKDYFNQSSQTAGTQSLKERLKKENEKDKNKGGSPGGGSSGPNGEPSVEDIDVGKSMGIV